MACAQNKEMRRYPAQPRSEGRPRGAAGLTAQVRTVTMLVKNAAESKNSRRQRLIELHVFTDCSRPGQTVVGSIQ